MRLVAAAIREIHPERFVTELDASTEIQPRLVSINTMLGRPQTERFFPIEFDRVVQRVRHYHSHGILGRVVQVSKSDLVLAALIAAAIQEGHPAGERLKPKTNLWLSYLNKYSKPVPEPMPNKG
jgi:hypothetical protein